MLATASRFAGIAFQLQTIELPGSTQARELGAVQPDRFNCLPGVSQFEFIKGLQMGACVNILVGIAQPSRQSRNCDRRGPEQNAARASLPMLSALHTVCVGPTYCRDISTATPPAAICKNPATVRAKASRPWRCHTTASNQDLPIIILRVGLLRLLL